MKHKQQRKGAVPCSKLSFPTKEAARRTMEIATAQRGENLKRLRVYLCPRCGQFHYTSKKKSEV